MGVPSADPAAEVFSLKTKQRKEAIVRVARAMAALALVVGAAGCNEGGGTTTGPQSHRVQITELIVNPRAPEPGDTVALAAVVVATDDAGNPVVDPAEFPVVQWSADGGSFLENGRNSVRWVAPGTTDVFLIACDASNSVSSDRADVDVFVTAPNVRASSGGGGITLMPTPGDFLYVAPTAGGWEVRRVAGGVESDAVPDANAVDGFDLSIAPDLAHAAYSKITPVGFQKPTESIDIWLDDLTAGTTQQITFDQQLPGSPRRELYVLPSFSPDGTMLSFTAIRPNVAAGAEDSVDIGIYDVASGVTTYPTEGHGRNRFNASSSFSPDNAWLVFVSDRAGLSQWELYALPIVGGVVATDSAATVRLTNTGGRIASGAFNYPNLFPQMPTLAWNGNAGAPLAAVLTPDGDLYIVDPAGPTQTLVSGFEAGDRVRQMAWSHDGATLAVSTFGALYVVSASGQATRVLSVPTGDAIRDVSWSGDDRWMVYRRTRGSIAWFELFDYTAGLRTRPFAITSVQAAGKVSSYAAVMDMGAPFDSRNHIYAAEFVSGQDAPRIIEIDLSGVVP